MPPLVTKEGALQSNPKNEIVYEGRGQYFKHVTTGLGLVKKRIHVLQIFPQDDMELRVLI